MKLNYVASDIGMYLVGGILVFWSSGILLPVRQCAPFSREGVDESDKVLKTQSGPNGNPIPPKGVITNDDDGDGVGDGNLLKMRR